MANPSGSTYLQANLSYVWANGDVYEIPQTDTTEGAATGASFSGLGVDNQPHQLLLNKIQWLYDYLTTLPHGSTQLTSGSGNFTVPGQVTGIWVRAWGQGGTGGRGNSTTYNSSGGGGGGGGYFEGVLTVTPGQVISWSISSSSTVFGSWSANAGSNGGNASAGGNFGTGGAGGTVGGSPPISFNGMSGEAGRAVNTPGTGNIPAIFYISGEGGQSFGCGHSHFGWAGSPGVGSTGIFPGQGGSGGISGAGSGDAGGAGGPGIIIVQW